MLGQLDWDGVVLPITEVTWENLLATADRLQGLDVNEDFFVTYKDEEGDVINVKNEVDLNEAILWAQDQGVPCLCLHVPFSAAESDSDESWTEIDNGSPRGTARKMDNEDVDELEKRSILREDVGEDSASVLPPADDSVPVSETPEDRAVGTTDEDDVSTVKDASTVESLDEPAVEDVVQPMEKEPPQLITEPMEELTKPATEGLVEESAFDHSEPKVATLAPIAAVFEDSQVLAAETVTPVAMENNGPGIDKIIEVMCSVNDSSIDDVNDKSYFLELIANPANVERILTFLSHPAVKNAISIIAQSERASEGAAPKATTTQLIKVLYQSPEVLGHLNAIPNLEEVLLRVLRALKPTPILAPTSTPVVEEEEEDFAEAPKTVHTLVTCDGCSDHDELRKASVAKGFRNAQGEILGIRYKSAVLPDYDLCESCESLGRFQSRAGPFLKIADPATAPEIILCAMPGATSGMFNQLESLDWRNPVAKEFFEFVRHKQQRAFKQQRDRESPPTDVATAVAQTSTSFANATVVPEPPAVEIKCKHLLKTFEAPHGSFTCDICSTRQALRSVLHGCRECNFDVCHTCYSEKDLGLKLSPPTAPLPGPVTVLATPAPVPAPAPQAKFVCDVTLTDGCAVRAGERLVKTWRVRNSGQERWPSGTRICHVGGDSFGGPMNGVEVPLASPGEAVPISVPLVMPQQAGRYTSYWRMVTPHPQSAKFGHRFWVTVNVLPLSASIAAQPPPAPMPFRAPPPPSPFARPVMLPGSPAIRVPPPPPPRYVETSPFEETVARIADFGFTDVEKIVRVLNEANGDAAAAIERLLEDA